MSNKQRKIAIVTDSTSDLTEEQLKEHDIRLLPLKVVYSDRQYIDRLEIQPHEIYERLEQEIPTTSMPSPGEAMALYRSLADEGYTDVLSVHISSGLSGTCQMARAVAKQLKDIINVEVIDSKALSWGVGVLATEAAKLVKAGVSFETLVDKINALQKEIKVFFVVKTLEYLRKGGRIGYVAGTIGEMLNVKPIVSINEEGKYYTYEKVRGRKRSVDRLAEIVLEFAKGKNIKAAVMHGNTPEEAKRVLEKLRLPNIEICAFGELGPVMAVHAGPGLLGVAFYAEK